MPLDDGYGRGDPLVEVDLVEDPFVEPGEDPQVLDDLLDPAQAVAGPVEQAGEVAQGVVEVDPVATLADLGEEVGGAVGQLPPRRSRRGP